jgi:hypothetical protein
MNGKIIELGKNIGNADIGTQHMASPVRRGEGQSSSEGADWLFQSADWQYPTCTSAI